MDIGSILKCKFSDNNDAVDTLRVTFKKTLNVKAYESEVVEAEASLKVPNNLVGIERSLYLAIMQAQLEYEVYYGLAVKNQITQQELVRRSEELTNGIYGLLNQARAITGKTYEEMFK